MISTTTRLVDFHEAELLQLFKLLADATRLRILMVLHDGEMNVTQFCQLLDQSQPAVSHHLRLLRNAGLIQLRRSGKHNFYSLNTESELPTFVSQLFDCVREESPVTELV